MRTGLQCHPHLLPAEHVGIVPAYGERALDDRRISCLVCASLLTLNPQAIRNEQPIARLL